MEGRRSRSVIRGKPDLKSDSHGASGASGGSRSRDRDVWRIKDGNSRGSGTESIPESIHKTERIRNVKKY